VRPQAAAPLPSLARSGNASPPFVKPEPVIALPANAITHIGGTTPVALASTAPAIVIEPARAAYNPMPEGAILPPRPTGRMRAQGGDERGWLARNWPVFVIILASIAIVVAVILMFVSPKSQVTDIGTKNGAGGPAPERMETNPLPPPSTDPWQNGQPPSGQPQQAPVPPPPTDPDDTTAIDPNDPLKDPFSNGGGTGNNQQFAFTLLGNITNRLCEKAKTCSDQTVATMCSGMSMIPVSPLPTSCPQATRCMEIIDQIDVCDAGLAGGVGGPNFPQLMMKTSDCMDALTRC
jgi:hypothetical protein